jgi:hypothetical protein
MGDKMGKVWEEVMVCGEKKQKSVKALFDSGASRCLIKPEIVEEVGGKYTGWEPVIKIADGRNVKVKEAELKSIRLLGQERPYARVYVLDGLPEEMLTGQDAMQEMGVTLEMREEKAVLKKSEQSVGYAY